MCVSVKCLAPVLKDRLPESRRSACLIHPIPLKSLPKKKKKSCQMEYSVNTKWINKSYQE